MTISRMAGFGDVATRPVDVVDSLAFSLCRHGGLMVSVQVGGVALGLRVQLLDHSLSSSRYWWLEMGFLRWGRTPRRWRQRLLLLLSSKRAIAKATLRPLHPRRPGRNLLLAAALELVGGTTPPSSPPAVAHQVDVEDQRAGSARWTFRTGAAPAAGTPGACRRWLAMQPGGRVRDAR